MVPETVAVMLANLLDLDSRGKCETSNASRGERHRSQNVNSVNNELPGAMIMVPITMHTVSVQSRRWELPSRGDKQWTRL